jgi:hypothetical protein
MSDPITDLKHELIAAAARQHRHAVTAGAASGRLRGGARRTRLALSAATLVAVAGAALFIAAPWRGSPDFLAKAQAALRPPPGTVLHARVRSTLTSKDPACSATRDHEIWVDERPPYRYRAIKVPAASAGDLAANPCSTWTGEIGGTVGNRALRFVAPNTLTATGIVFLGPVDPVKTLRDALSAGKAVDEGRTRLGGRTVERIRIEGCGFEASGAGPACPGESSYAYVDPHTFQPIEMDGHAVFNAPDRPAVVLQSVSRFLTYEYLPATAANRALANIRAQHPNATVSG